MPSTVDEDAIRSKTMANQPFNMNNPPTKAIPHQEFPKMMYLWPRDKTLAPGTRTAVANSLDEEKALTAKGYRAKPHVQQWPEELPDGFEPDTPAAAEAGDGESSQQPKLGLNASSSALQRSSKEDLLAHAKDVHGLEIDPATTKAEIIAKVQEAQAKS